MQAFLPLPLVPLGAETADCPRRLVASRSAPWPRRLARYQDGWGGGGGEIGGVKEEEKKEKDMDKEKEEEEE